MKIAFVPYALNTFVLLYFLSKFDRLATPKRQVNGVFVCVNAFMTGRNGKWKFLEK